MREEHDEFSIDELEQADGAEGGKTLERLKDKEERKKLVQTIMKPGSIDTPEELKAHDDDKKLKDQSRILSWTLNITTVVSIVAMVYFMIKGFKLGIFDSQESMANFVNGLGPAAPLVFVIIQIIQVIIPIVPGAFGTVVGVVVFGPWLGFLYNYIGICLGSIAVFFLSRRYGKPLVLRMIGKKNYNRYIGWTTDNKNFETIFTVLIFLPVAPDDALCYLAGLTEMTVKRFIAIIILGKPAAIALYSLGLSFFLKEIIELIRGFF